MEKHYDFFTHNRSFIEVSKQLRSLGVMNHQFMLEIYDTSLIGVDPYDSDLSEEIKEKIRKECEINPWYYLREMAYMDDYGAKIKLRITRGTAAQIYCMLNGIDAYLVTCRQTGKDSTLVMFYTWVIFISQYKNLTSYFVANSHNGSCDMLDRVRKHISALPKYIYSTDHVHIKKTAIGDKWSCNMIKSFTTLNRPEAVREYVFELVKAYPAFNEVEYSNNSYYYLTEYENMRKLIHIPCPFGVAMSTITGSYEDANCAAIVDRVIANSIRWYDAYYDSIDDFRTLINEKSIGIAYIEYSYKQLGLSDEWARHMYKVLCDDNHFRREILLQREVPKQTFEEMIANVPSDLPINLNS